MHIRRRARRTGTWKRRKPPIPLFILLGVLLFTGLVVLCGNILAGKVEAYRESKRLEQYMPPKEELIHTDVPAIQASAYRLGASAARYGQALSATVRQKDGILLWNSATETAVGFASQNGTDLATALSDLHSDGKYVSLCFSAPAPSEEDIGIRDIREAYEIALLREVAQAGADEIVLTDLYITEQNITAVKDFLYRVKIAIGDCPLGVSLSYDAVSRTQNGVYLAAAVRSVSDFLLLDLRVSGIGVKPDGTPYTYDEIFDLCQYDINRFSMRLLLDKETAELTETAEQRGIENWQITDSR